jgi:hypothetical protein
VAVGINQFSMSLALSFPNFPHIDTKASTATKRNEYGLSAARRRQLASRRSLLKNVPVKCFLRGSLICKLLLVRLGLEMGLHNPQPVVPYPGPILVACVGSRVLEPIYYLATKYRCNQNWGVQLYRVIKKSLCT